MNDRGTIGLASHPPLSVESVHKGCLTLSSDLGTFGRYRRGGRFRKQAVGKGEVIVLRRGWLDGGRLIFGKVDHVARRYGSSGAADAASVVFVLRSRLVCWMMSRKSLPFAWSLVHTH